MHIPFLLSLCTILLGYSLKRIGFLKMDDSRLLSRIIMNMTFPSQILLTISRSTLSADLLLLPWIPVLMAIVGFSIGLIIFKNSPQESKGLFLMGTMGLNIGLFAFPILQGVYGDLGMQVAALIDVGNAFMIFGFAYLVGSRYSPGDKSGRRGLLETIKVFLRSLPLWAYSLGILISVRSWTIPPFLSEWLEILGRGNQFLVLLVLGLVLSFDFRHLLKGGLIPLILLRYALGISFGILVWHFLPVDILIRKIAVLCLILPAGFAIVPYSMEFEYDKEKAGAIVNISLIISFFLMWSLTYIL